MITERMSDSIAITSEIIIERIFALSERSIACLNLSLIQIYCKFNNGIIAKTTAYTGDCTVGNTVVIS